MVSSLWPPAVLGGAEAYAAALSARLHRLGHDVGVVTFGVPGPDVVAEVRPWPYRLDEYADASAHRRALFHLLDVYRPATAGAIARAIHDFEPDVVHSHAVAGMSSTVLAEPSRRGVGHVHTLHDYWLLCQRSTLVSRDGGACEQRCRSCTAISAVRNRIASRHSPDAVLAVSRAVAAQHEAIEWMTGRVRVVYNPVEPIERQPHSVTTDAPVFGFLGRLAREKGAATLVKAFEVAPLPPTARLVVAGDGPERAALARAAGPRVELVGHLDANARERFFARVDCLVVPSEWEDPAPLVVNEARARGIPVIGARAGGILELVSPACAPLLFSAGDVGELASRLVLLADDPSAYSRDDGVGLLDWPTHLDRVIEAYDDAQRLAESRT
jgi:glycosyltransferase involved in cell wall biosynthesis